MDTTATIYARLSSNRDGEKAATLEGQQTRGRAIADLEGFSLIETLTDDDVSGTKSDRPGYRQLIHMIETGQTDVVIVQHMDRIARDLEDRAHFVKLCRRRSILIRTWDGYLDLESPEGEAMHGMGAVMDQWYSRQVAKKQKQAHERRVKAGKVNGLGRMFGEQDGEAPIVQEMVTRILAGNSMLSVVRWLNSSGIKTRRGKQWTATGLRLLLTNPRLTGVLMSDGKEVGVIADYTPVLDVDTFDELQVVIDSKARQPKRGRPSRLLTPYMRCSGCQGKMTVSHNANRSYYRCDLAHDCPSRQTVTADKVDEYVYMHALDRLVRQIRAEGPRTKPERSEYIEELRVLKARREELGIAYAEGDITRDAMVAGIKTIEEKIENLRSVIPPQSVEERLIQVREEIQAGTREPDMEIRKRAIAEAVVSVTVLPVKRAPRLGFDYDRLEVLWKV